jgi:hypothetical protein
MVASSCDLGFFRLDRLKMAPQIADMTLQRVVLAGHPAHFLAKQLELVPQGMAPGGDPVALHLGQFQLGLGRIERVLQGLVLIEQPPQMRLGLLQIPCDADNRKLIVGDLVEKLTIGGL